MTPGLSTTWSASPKSPFLPEPPPPLPPNSKLALSYVPKVFNTFYERKYLWGQHLVLFNFGPYPAKLCLGATLSYVLEVVLSSVWGTMQRSSPFSYG